MITICLHISISRTVWRVWTSNPLIWIVEGAIIVSWVWHNFYYISACWPGHESRDCSMAVGPVAPPDITSGADLTKEPFKQVASQYVPSNDLLMWTCDGPCPQGRYIYIYSNSTTPATIQICDTFLLGTCRYLHNLIPCSPKGDPHIVLWLHSPSITQTYGLLMITSDCCHVPLRVAVILLPRVFLAFRYCRCFICLCVCISPCINYGLVTESVTRSS